MAQRSAGSPATRSQSLRAWPSRLWQAGDRDRRCSPPASSRILCASTTAEPASPPGGARGCVLAPSVTPDRWSGNAAAPMFTARRAHDQQIAHEEFGNEIAASVTDAEFARSSASVSRVRNRHQPQEDRQRIEDSSRRRPRPGTAELPSRSARSGSQPASVLAHAGAPKSPRSAPASHWKPAGRDRLIPDPARPEMRHGLRGRGLSKIGGGEIAEAAPLTPAQRWQRHRRQESIRLRPGAGDQLCGRGCAAQAAHG